MVVLNKWWWVFTRRTNLGPGPRESALFLLDLVDMSNQKPKNTNETKIFTSHARD